LKEFENAINSASAIDSTTMEMINSIEDYAEMFLGQALEN
jgi:hypothetical protein